MTWATRMLFHNWQSRPHMCGCCNGTSTLQMNLNAVIGKLDSVSMTVWNHVKHADKIGTDKFSGYFSKNQGK